jgi:hypothetical protein
VSTSVLPATDRTPRTRTVAAYLGIGGVLLAIGGQLHPMAPDDGTLAGALATMTGDGAWLVAHLLMLAGLSLALVGLATAYRHRVLGPSLDSPLRLAIWGYAFGAFELVPHLFAAGDHDQLAAGQITGLVRVHLVLQAFAGPALALSTIVLAIGIARSTRSKPAWVLAGIAVLGGTAFALAGPLIALTSEPKLAPLFAGELAVAVWLVGTSIRMARSR